MLKVLDRRWKFRWFGIKAIIHIVSIKTGDPICNKEGIVKQVYFLIDFVIFGLASCWLQG